MPYWRSVTQPPPELDHDKLIAEAIELGRRGKLLEAEHRCRLILEENPDHPDALHLLGVVAMETGHGDAAVELIGRAIELSPAESALLLANHAKAYQCAGRLDDAGVAYRRAIALDPRLLGVMYDPALLPMPAQPEERRPEEAPRDTLPADYVEQLFNCYAPFFDSHLEHLEYQAPTALRACFDQDRGDSADKGTVLDLGCGTGLSGKAFHDVATRLYGSDLSGDMLARAAELDIYDELWREDLTATLKRFDDEVDLVVAADVFVYVGALNDVFAAASKAIRPGGSMLFSVERDDDQDYVLRDSHRFAHSLDYISSLASEHGFDIAREQAATLRKEDQKPMPGYLFLLRRQSPG